MWSETQRRMLAAMGYTLYARAGVASIHAEPASPPAAPSMPEPEPARRTPRADDRLWQALCRAAGDGDVSVLVDDLDALRRDPGRKRALWPQLRALRRH